MISSFKWQWQSNLQLDRHGLPCNVCERCGIRTCLHNILLFALPYQYNHLISKSLAYLHNVTSPSHNETTSKTNTRYPSRSVGLLVARETGCSQSQSPIWAGKPLYSVQQSPLLCRKPARSIPSHWWQTMLTVACGSRGVWWHGHRRCVTLFSIAGCFLSELWRSLEEQGHGEAALPPLN